MDKVTGSFLAATRSPERENTTNLIRSRYADKFQTLTLVIAGERDYRDADGTSAAAFTALQHRKVPSRLLLFLGENHWVGKPLHSRLRGIGNGALTGWDGIWAPADAGRSSARRPGPNKEAFSRFHTVRRHAWRGSALGAPDFASHAIPRATARRERRILQRMKHHAATGVSPLAAALLFAASSSRNTPAFCAVWSAWTVSVYAVWRNLAPEGRPRHITAANPRRWKV